MPPDLRHGGATQLVIRPRAGCIEFRGLDQPRCDCASKRKDSKYVWHDHKKTQTFSKCPTSAREIPKLRKTFRHDSSAEVDVVSWREEARPCRRKTTFVGVRSKPFFFFSWAEEWPMSTRRSFLRHSWPVRNFEKASCGFSFLCPINIVEHRHWRRFDLQISLDVLDKLPVCLESLGEFSNVVCPGKIYHSNSSGSPSIPNKSLNLLEGWKYWSWSFHFAFASVCS